MEICKQWLNETRFLTFDAITKRGMSVSSAYLSVLQSSPLYLFLFLSSRNPIILHRVLKKRCENSNRYSFASFLKELHVILFSSSVTWHTWYKLQQNSQHSFSDINSIKICHNTAGLLPSASSAIAMPYQRYFCSITIVIANTLYAYVVSGAWYISANNFDKCWPIIKILLPADSSKFPIKRQLNMPPVKRVATLPCEIFMSENQRHPET